MESTLTFLKKQLPFILILMFVILAVRSSIIEPFRIPTRSMLPGLMTGDFFICEQDAIWVSCAL